MTVTTFYNDRPNVCRTVPDGYALTLESGHQIRTLRTPPYLTITAIMTEIRTGREHSAIVFRADATRSAGRFVVDPIHNHFCRPDIVRQIASYYTAHRSFYGLEGQLEPPQESLLRKVLTPKTEKPKGRKPKPKPL